MNTASRQPEPATHRQLARGGRWSGFELAGLAVDASGALGLAELPDLDTMGDAFAPLPGLEGPFGIAADDRGHVYAADPTGHRVLRIDACDGSIRPLPCLRGPGAGPGELDTPRGVAIRDGILFIADSGNARIVLVDLRSGQLRGIWGSRSPQPGRPATPGTFITPWDLAVDRNGGLYVADVGEAGAAGGRRFGGLQRFTAGGVPDAAFARTLGAQSVVPTAPAAVATGLLPREGAETEHLIVLDRTLERVLVYRPDGSFDEERTARWRTVTAGVPTDSTVAIGSNRIYVAGPSGGILVFEPDGRLLGTAPTGLSRVAGLALDCDGRLLAHPGAGGSLLRAAGAPAFATCGAFLAGPFTGELARTRWQRIRLAMRQLPEGAHVRLFTLTSDCLDGSVGQRITLRPRAPGAAVPGLPLCATSWAEVPACAEPVRDSRLGTPGETARGEWARGAWDAQDLHIPNEPARHLWIAGVLQGDGRTTPRIGEFRVDHDRGGWIRFLPGMYRRDAQSRAFLEPFLLLYETVHEDSSCAIDELPRLFDPHAAPDTTDAPWLDWLAGWFDFPIHETWSAAVRRETVADAFRLQAGRGTIGSLRHRLRLYAGVEAAVLDGARRSGPWILGSMPLGFETRLTSAEPQGAVLGTTATLDRSHIIDPAETGAPLVDGVTHCFTVQVYRADLGPDRPLERVRAVVEREKPAHTIYRICVIEPRMRIGYQATVGVDTIVAGPPRVAAWDGTRRLGHDTVLPEDRPGGERKLGERVREVRLA